jgi:hypothetical protein
VPVAVAVVALERRSVLAVVSVPASEPRVPGQRLAVVAEPQVPGQVSEPQVSEPQASEPQVPGPGQRLAPVAAQPEQEPRARPVAWLVPVSALQPEVKVARRELASASGQSLPVPEPVRPPWPEPACSLAPVRRRRSAQPGRWRAERYRPWRRSCFRTRP